MTMTQSEKRKLLAKDDPVVLEIGSHIGTDTREFLDEFPGIRIYCFEPDPRCIAQFKESIQDDRCVLTEAAVSNTEGTMTLNISGGWPVKVPQILKNLGLKKLCTLLVLKLRKLRGIERNSTGQSSICKVTSHSRKYPWLSFEESVEVKSLKLDTWVTQQGLEAVDMMWIDVQGAERFVIEGAAKTLSMTTYVHMEYGEVSCYEGAMTREETVELMKRHGFAVLEAYSGTRKRGDLLLAKMPAHR